MFLQQTMTRSVGRSAVLQAVIATSSWRRNDLDVASDTVALCWHFARSTERQVTYMPAADTMQLCTKHFIWCYNYCRSFFVARMVQRNIIKSRVLNFLTSRCGAGHPSFPLDNLLLHLFPFSLFSFFHWLYLFSSFVHPFPFYQNSPTPFPGRRS